VLFRSPDREAEDVETDIKLFHIALAATRDSIKRLNDNMAAGLPPEERALFDVYLKMLDSASLTEEVIEEIKQGHWVQSALRRVIDRHVSKFEAMDDSYLRERATDIKDLGERVLFYLQAGESNQKEYPEQTILVGEEVTPAALAEVPEGRLAGVISVRGSSNSHVAILARALGVPTVMGVSGLKVNQADGQDVVVDGYYGQVYLSPSVSLRNEFLNLLKEEREFDTELKNLHHLPAETHDNHTIALYVNTGLEPDVGRSLSVGAEGVGLYRTEVPFMTRDRFPSEEEQRILYRQLLKAFMPRRVIMRTLDVGGDKSLPYFSVEEDNPFLGWRGMRITLDHPEIFLVQVRAMMRASVGLDNLSIMFPMITTVGEVEEALRLLKQAYEELLNEGLQVVMPKVGVMIEVPSAVYQAQVLARRVDFLSVGSNDLTQYLLAVDRNNPRVASLYDGLHPAILRAIMQVVAGGHREDKSVSICGEMAGDPAAVILLLAMGFDTLSMSASRLPRVKWVIRNFSLKRAKQLLDEVLAMDDAIEIRNHMELALEEAGLGGLVRAGR
jgi:phosphotransferase system, enzyme I, PtsP